MLGHGDCNGGFRVWDQLRVQISISIYRYLPFSLLRSSGRLLPSRSSTAFIGYMLPWGQMLQEEQEEGGFSSKTVSLQ